MNSIISLGQKNTLAKYMILSDADNRPPMLDKDLYDSWKNQGPTEEEWNDPIISEKGSPDYIDATLEQELESMECQEESLLRNEVLLEYEVKIEAQRVHSIEIEKITRFPTHTPTVTPKTLKPTIVHRVSMISKIEPTNYKTPHQHLNFNLKMPILLSFEENKLEYEDEDATEIKMMGTEIDKESLEHNLYENDITPIICHNFSPTSNPPIKPKDSCSFRMKVVEPLTIHTLPSPHVAYLYQKEFFPENEENFLYSVWRRRQDFS
ncbi:hypothetical protein Tco_0815241 [Tanacetum coccineum]